MVKNLLNQSKGNYQDNGTDPTLMASLLQPEKSGKMVTVTIH